MTNQMKSNISEMEKRMASLEAETSQLEADCREKMANLSAPTQWEWDRMTRDERMASIESQIWHMACDDQRKLHAMPDDEEMDVTKFVLKSPAWKALWGKYRELVRQTTN